MFGYLFKMGTNFPDTPLEDPYGRRAFANNVKEMNTILCGLAKSVFMKVKHYKSTKEIWDKLQRTH